VRITVRTLLLAAAFLLLAAGGVLALETSGEVLWVYDGDTLQVAGVGKVRLIGVDTPEKEASDRDRFLERQGIPPATLRRIATEASLFTRTLCKGKTVRLTFDRTGTDRHGRTLAYLTLPDGRSLNRLLLEKGLAVVYRRFDFKAKEDFLAAEAAARAAGQGLWGK